MANFNANAAGAASASLIIESQRQQVNQPAEKPSAAGASSVALSEGDQVSFSAYTVKKGDTLWDIADAKLGDATKWPVLFALNREQIKNPDLIYPGQVLTVPSQFDVAPEQPKPALPNPVDYEPVPAEPQAPAQPVDEPIAAEPPVTPQPQQPVSSVEEEIISRTETIAQIPAKPVVETPQPVPVAVEPEPIVSEPKPTPAPQPVQVEPEPVVVVKPEPVAPPVAEPKKPLLRHPSELPAPYDPTPISVITEPVVEPEPTVEPIAEEPTPTQPVDAPVETPKPQIPTVVGEASKAQPSSGVGKVALVGGAIGAVGTGAYLVGLTRGIGSNLGGYASAQVVAKGINSVTSKVGFKVPSGPALSKLVSKVGGPKVAGAVTAIAAGAVVAGVAAGGYYVYKKATSGGDESSPEVKPQTTRSPNEAALPAGNNPVADIQPVEPNAAPSVDLSAKFQKLEQLLDQKQYMYFGKLTQPEDVRATGVQIWLEGNVSDRVKLANILVDNSQSELLGRVMAHEETNPLEIAQVMSQPDFPVQGYMNGLDDNQAFLVLNSLSSVAVTGEPSSIGVISKTIQGYDRMIDREAPFDRLKNHHMAQGSWESLPASLRSDIDQLIK